MIKHGIALVASGFKHKNTLVNSYSHSFTARFRHIPKHFGMNQVDVLSTGIVNFSCLEL